MVVCGVLNHMVSNKICFPIYITVAGLQVTFLQSQEADDIK